MATMISPSGAYSDVPEARTLQGLIVPSRFGFVEGGHQLEKLEFALAIAEARGDQIRCSRLRHQIADLGGNAEEPGT